MSERSDVIAASETLRAYDQWAAHYDADDNPLVAATARCLRARPLDVAGARVIELGCGTGRNAPRLLEEGALGYTGVDGSAGMLAEARRRVNDARCQWVEAELAQLPPPSGQEALHDVGLIVLVLEHLTDLDGPFGALARWLRPGASLRILELHPERIEAGTVAHFHEGGVERRFSSVAHPVEAVKAALARCGFEVVWVEEVIADEELIAAVPRVAKHRGKKVVMDVLAQRRG
jgi:ubiquinone/menaquinone biosynthesis C-methylase UbiE